jgi:hypothetical protein
MQKIWVLIFGYMDVTLTFLGINNSGHGLGELDESMAWHIQHFVAQISF